MTDLASAILAINEKAVFTINNEDVKEITWYKDTSPIAEADILAKQKELQTAYDNNAYQRSRAVEYPEIKEQLDLLYKDMLADKGDKTGAWFAAVKAVKDKYAKE